MRLLLVEDNAALSRRLKTSLKKLGFAVDLVDNGVDAQHEGLEIDYDAVILDLGLPKKSGLDVLRHWRQQGRHFPVLILTARDEWHERVDGFKAGADDYLGKPFHVEELEVRIRALIRRQSDATAHKLHVGDYQLNEATQQLESCDGNIVLTGVEFRLLRYFLLNPGRVLSKSRLTEHIYENDADKDSNVIEVYVSHLRTMLGKDIIKTRRGQGYVYQENH